MACLRARQRRGRCQRSLISPRLGTVMCGCTAGGRSSTLSSSGSKLTSYSRNTSTICSELKIQAAREEVVGSHSKECKSAAGAHSSVVDVKGSGQVLRLG